MQAISHRTKQNNRARAIYSRQCSVMRGAGARYELTFPAVLTRVRCQRRSLLSLPLPEETETRGGRTPNSKFNVSLLIVCMCVLLGSSSCG